MVKILNTFFVIQNYYVKFLTFSIQSRQFKTGNFYLKLLPLPLDHSPITAPKGIFFPQFVDSGLDSISFMYVEKTRILKSEEPAQSSTLFGCQSRESTVERIGFLMCLLTHLKMKNTVAFLNYTFGYSKGC